MKRTLALCTTLTLFCATAQAAPINNNFGLTSSDNTLTFSELPYTNAGLNGDAYAAYGITFNHAVGFHNSRGSIASLTDQYISHYGTEISILFGADQSEATFALTMTNANVTFTARLNGADVESFTTNVNHTNTASGYFGFNGILFDEINIDSNGLATKYIDTIQYGNGVAAVPAPAALSLMGLGLLGMGFAGRGQRKP